MPETPINKHRDLQLGENEIGFAEHGLMATLVGDAMPAEQGNQRKLGCLVGVPAHS